MKKLLLLLFLIPNLVMAEENNSYSDVRDALINAHKAGDTNAVEELSNYLYDEIIILRKKMSSASSLIQAMKENQLPPSPKLPPCTIAQIGMACIKFPLSLPPCDMVLEGQNCLKMP